MAKRKRCFGQGMGAECGCTELPCLLWEQHPPSTSVCSPTRNNPNTIVLGALWWFYRTDVRDYITGHWWLPQFSASLSSLEVRDGAESSNLLIMSVFLSLNHVQSPLEGLGAPSYQPSHYHTKDTQRSGDSKGFRSCIPGSWDKAQLHISYCITLFICDSPHSYYLKPFNKRQTFLEVFQKKN